MKSTDITRAMIDAAARRIFQMTADQPWEAANMAETENAYTVAIAALHSALEQAPKASISDESVEAAANAISECAGMRYDGFWSRVEDLEPEDREYALMEARAALEAAA